MEAKLMQKKGIFFGFMILSIIGFLMITPALALEVDMNLPAYKSVGGVSGKIKSIGSDTLNNLMTLWSEGYRSNYPSVKIEIEGKGSSTAPPALIQGASQIGPMSRKMKDKEIDAFVNKFGYKPTRLSIAIDSLAIYVNKDNPIEGLSIPEVDAIFSKNRNCGHNEDITTWGQTGLTGSCPLFP